VMTVSSLLPWKDPEYKIFVIFPCNSLNDQRNFSDSLFSNSNTVISVLFFIFSVFLEVYKL
jgi:hypothetical protein